MELVYKAVKKIIYVEMNDVIVKEFTKEEIQQALAKMNPNS